MQPLPPLGPTRFRSPTERLRHGTDPARCLDGDGPRAWESLEREVRRATSRGCECGGTVEVGGCSSGCPFADGEEAGRSAAPHRRRGRRTTWRAEPPADAELALGLCHADPRVREAAVGRSAGRPGLLPLVVLRCADADEPVRTAARTELAAALRPAGDAAVRSLVPLAVLMRARRHGVGAWDLLLARLGSVPVADLARLTADPDPEVRHPAVKAALHHGVLPADRVAAIVAEDPAPGIALTALRRGGLPGGRVAGFVLTGRTPEIRRESLELVLRTGASTPARLAEIAAESRDPVVRRRCEEALADFLGDPRGEPPAADLLDALLGNSRSAVRAHAVGALRGAGRAHETSAHLSDPAARVREAARRALRAAGEDPAAHYRAACSRPAPAPAAVLGLAETAQARDLPRLWELARHPEGRIRTAALSGLRRQRAATPEQLLSFLGDPHAPVGRAVRSAVLPYARSRPQSWLLGLFARDRPAGTGAAGLTLVGQRPLLVRRRLAGSLTSHPDRAVRRWARHLLQQRLTWDLAAGLDAARELVHGEDTPLDEVIDTSDPHAWTALDLAVRRLVPHPDRHGRIEIALCHPDGRVREAAIRSAAGRPDLLPLVVLRGADWTPQVRGAAQSVLLDALRNSGPPTLRTATPMVTHLRGRREARWAVGAFEAALRDPAHAEVLTGLYRHPHLPTRRAAVRIGLEAAPSAAAEPARRAAREPDAVLRHLWTDAALAALAAHGPDAAALDALLGSRSGSVRAAGVTALRAAGRAGEAERHLADPSALVRSCARWLIGQRGGQGGDARAHYLRRCADAPSPGAVLGLAECARREDSGVLLGLLGHPEGPVRAAAVAALRLLGGPGSRPEVLRPLLDDPAPAVAREVTLSLLPVAGLLPADWLASRTGRGRPAHTRRAAVRLLAVQGSDEALRAAVALLDDPDPLLRRAALALLRRWDWPATAERGGLDPRELRGLFHRYASENGWSESLRRLHGS
ncbi:hypothetical protein [Streptomyces sp. NPDC001568]|uniref:hypothetical protein n=1 Tax=Streptomyces sp. NPDC001568 TaxID=3364588 RepID=UPI0036926F33